MIAKQGPRLLMCRPEHFGVVYAINPWMNPGDWQQEERVLAAQSRREWMELRHTLAGLGADIELVPAASGVPDLVFTANSAVVLDRKAHVFFGDRAILLDAAARHPSAGKLMVLERLFTYEPVALVLARGDEDFRLAVDRALSGFYASGELNALYVQWFGEADENARNFFRWNALQ